jgi:predicted AlkP superfamily pyrophosphatase or phosphodiesterase
MCIDCGAAAQPERREAEGGLRLGPLLTRRAFLAGAAAGLVAACTRGSPSPPAETPPFPFPSPGPGGLTGSLPEEVMRRVWRGAMPGRSGDIVYVPAGLNFLDGGISHSVPWPYMQLVPMLWYGPGVIRAQRPVTRPVTSADVAPTLGLLTGHRFETPDAHPMEEILEPGAKRPRLIVVFVWDGAGSNVLELWPDSWPNLAALAAGGTSYGNATVGSSPSTTAPVHATMGTGVFPRQHGVLDSYIRFEDGVVGDSWSRGPAGMLAPTFADDYGEATGHRAVIGIVASLSWHLGMMGHGRQASAGATQLAALRQSAVDTGAESPSWGMADPVVDAYRFPDYVREQPPLAAYLDGADASDGTLDGTWMGHPFDELNGGFHSPARIPYQQLATEEMVRREGFGQDDVPDLLFLNSKLIDEVGHLFTASGPEMGAAIRAQDADLPRFLRFLDRTVGKGRWALLLTADHGHTAHPQLTGAFRIQVPILDEIFDQVFPGGRRVIERIRTSWAFVDRSELRRRGQDAASVAALLAGLTKEQLVRDPSRVTVAERSQRAFAAAAPTSALDALVTG